VELRRDRPHAEVIVHPECRPEVIDLADQVLSTGGMCRYASESSTREIIVGTEIGIIHRLRKENPAKRFFPVSEQAVCPRMKLITLEKIAWSLEDMTPVVKVPEETRLRARKAVDRMLEIGQG
jgi:quinolinate synthase